MTRTPDAFANLAAQCRMLSLPEPVAEFRFHPTRKWKFDAAWPDFMIAVEFEGIIYRKDGSLGGRHVMATGFKGDIVKYAEAFALGWAVLRVLPEMTGRNAKAVSWLERRIKRGIP
jgi:hypothetical protein